MGKVITSQGLQDFIETGAISQVPNHVKGTPAPVAVVPAPVIPEPAPVVLEPVAAVPEPAPEPAPPVEPTPADDYEGISDADQAWIKSAADEIERTRRYANKRLKIAKQEEARRIQAETETAAAKAAAEDAEDFAKGQYNRAVLAEERAAVLQRERDALKTAQTPPLEPAPEAKAPDIKEFTNAEGQVDWDKFTDAKATYAADKAVAKDRAERAAEESRAQQAQVDAAFRKRLSAAETKYPDFLQVVGATDLMVPNAVLNYITMSEYGADITYHLASHPDQAERIAKLPPIKAIAEIGKLELSFEKPAAVTPPPAEPAPKPVQVPTPAPAPAVAAPAPIPAPKAAERGGAPPPITPISTQGSGTVITDPSKMSFTQLRAYERQRAVEKKRR